MNALGQLIRIAEDLAASTPGFVEIKGAGDGDRATAEFMRQLRALVAVELPSVRTEQRICGKNSLAVDFYLPEQATVVEVALSLRNPLSEFEKDILKVLMANDQGCGIKKLVFVSKPGAVKRHRQPGSSAFVDWAKRHHGLAIEFHEVGGRPTKG